MVERLTNKFTILLTLQRRLDADEISKYEAVLGMLALQRLFCLTNTGVFISSDDLWAFYVHQRLKSIITSSGDNPVDIDANNNWMNIWLTHRVSDMAVAEVSSAELLASTRGNVNGLYKISSAAGVDRNYI